MFPELHVRLHSPGAISCGRMRPDPGKQDGAMATSSRCQQTGASEIVGVAAGYPRGEWVQVYKLCRVKTVCVAAYSVMYNPTFLLLPLVSFPPERFLAPPS